MSVYRHVRVDRLTAVLLPTYLTPSLGQTRPSRSHATLHTCMHRFDVRSTPMCLLTSTVVLRSDCLLSHRSLCILRMASGLIIVMSYATFEGWPQLSITLGGRCRLQWKTLSLHAKIGAGNGKVLLLRKIGNDYRRMLE